MANVRVTDFTAAATVDPANDQLGMVDVSDTTQHASGTTKKVTPTMVVASVKIDDLAAADDNTDLNASASAHGLLPKLSGTDTEFLNGTGQWATPAGGGGLSNVVEDTTPQLGGQLDVNGNALGDGARELLDFVEDASAVNHVQVENEATGSGPIVRSTGDDANVDLNIGVKGTATVNVTTALDVTGNITVSGTVDGVDIAALSTSEGAAIHDNVSGEIAAITEKATPTSTDLIIIEDAAASNAKKKVQIGNLPGGGGGISNVVEDTTPQLGGQLDVNGNAIGDGTRELLTFTEDASAVNHVNIENQATGGGPIIRAAGDDTNVDLNLDGQGTSTVNVLTDLDVTGDITVSGTVDGVDVAALSTSEAAAIHDNVSGEIAAITAKATPTSSDFLLIEDAAASNAKKRITIGDLPGGGGLPVDDGTVIVENGSGNGVIIDCTSLTTDRTWTAPNQNIDLTPNSGSFDKLPVDDGTVIVQNGSGNGVIIDCSSFTVDRTWTPPGNVDATLVGTTTVQTLTNKTLTAPVISTISNSGTVTLPTGTRTLVARDTTDTLTNKTLGATTLSGDLTRASDQVIDLTGAATRTLYVVNSTASQVANLETDGRLVLRNGTTQTMTLSGTPTTSRTITFPDTTDTVVTLASTQTLTNKTLTTPTIASFTNATHDHSNAAGGGVIEDLVWALFFGGGPNILEFEEVTEPTTPSDGDAYFLAATPTGTNWSGNGGTVALYKGTTWYFYTPVNGTSLHVDTAAAHHWSGARIAYSADESEWYPLTPDWWDTTEFWTGTYYTGTTEKRYCKCFSGTLDTGTDLVTEITHSVTIDRTVPAYAVGSVTNNSNLGVFTPQDFSTGIVYLQVYNSVVRITGVAATTGWEYEVKMFYAK